MYSKLPYIKPKYCLNRKGAENLTLACYDKYGYCITGYIDYSDIIEKRPIKKLLYRAYYRDTKDGNLRVRKYL